MIYVSSAITVLLVLVLVIACGLLAMAVADDKGHNGFSWFLAGVFLGPVGLIAAAGLGDRKLRRYQRFIAEGQGYEEKKVTNAGDAAQQIIDSKRTGGGSMPWMK